MTETKENLGGLLRKARKEKELTLRKVEEKTGISYSYLSQLESGERSAPGLDVLGTLFSLYGLPLEKIQDFKHYDLVVPIGNKIFIGQIKANAKTNLQKKRVEHVTRCFMDLSEEGQEELLNFLEYLLKKEKRKGN